MEGNDDVLLPPVIAELDAKLAVALDRGQVEIGGSVADLRGHKWNEHTSREKRPGSFEPVEI